MKRGQLRRWTRRAGFTRETLENGYLCVLDTHGNCIAPCKFSRTELRSPSRSILTKDKVYICQNKLSMSMKHLKAKQAIESSVKDRLLAEFLWLNNFSGNSHFFSPNRMGPLKLLIGKSIYLNLLRENILHRRR